MSEERFAMVVLKDHNEVTIIDTEEENALLFGCNCEDEDLFFLKQDVDQVVRYLNFQDTWIKELIEENKNLKAQIEKE